MNYKSKTLEELAKKGNAISSKCALVGMDGFVDRIMSAVDERTGQGENFTAITKIKEFGKRITAAAGKSTNIELFPRMEKLGGNGPILANALLEAGLKVNYLGALGNPSIHTVFKKFAARTDAVSLCEPGLTDAVEFKDGKIMFGNTTSLDQITYSRIIEVMGEGSFFDAVSRADAIALVNWTMIPNMTSILVSILEKVLPNLGPREGRLFFFDLSDPEKRSEGDIKTVLSTLTRFRSYGKVILGLNLKEAEHVFSILGHKNLKPSSDNLKKMASRIRQDMDASCVVIHPVDSAACATRSDSWWVAGPLTDNPKITTGAGDHFNSGFITGQLLGLGPAACLILAVSASGHYVRTAKSPSLFDLDNFIRKWS